MTLTVSIWPHNLAEQAGVDTIRVALISLSVMDDGPGSDD